MWRYLNPIWYRAAASFVSTYDHATKEKAFNEVALFKALARKYGEKADASGNLPVEAE